MLQGAAIVPMIPPPTTLVPFISHSATAPFVFSSNGSLSPSP